MPETAFQKGQRALSLANMLRRKLEAVAEELRKPHPPLAAIADDLLLTGKDLQQEMIQIFAKQK